MKHADCRLVDDPLRMAKAYREWLTEHYRQLNQKAWGVATFLKVLDAAIIDETLNETTSEHLASRIRTEANHVGAQEVAGIIVGKWMLRSIADDDTLDFGQERFDAAFAALRAGHKSIAYEIIASGGHGQNGRAQGAVVG